MTGEIIRLNAGNDRNGNPRRIFVFIRDCDILGAWDEEYKGSKAMPEKIRNKWNGLTIATTPAEYRDILKSFGTFDAHNSMERLFGR